MAPYGGEPLQWQVIDKYEGRLPESFLDFWRVSGLGKWCQGYFQFCNPDKYQPVIDLIFDGDPEFHPSETYAPGFSAFGEIIAWNEKCRVLNIDTLNNSVSCGQYFKPKPNIPLDISLGGAVERFDSEVYNPFDESGKRLFKRVLKACGEVEFGQIYAFKLHPALGGPVVVESFRRADALVAISIAAQTSSYILYNTTIPCVVPAVRNIGK